MYSLSVTIKLSQNPITEQVSIIASAVISNNYSECIFAWGHHKNWTLMTARTAPDPPRTSSLHQQPLSISARTELVYATPALLPNELRTNFEILVDEEVY